MADRKVTFTLGTAVDPQAKREAAEMAGLLNSVKKAAEGATKAIEATLSASSRGRGGPGGGSGASRGPSGGGRGYSAFNAGMSAGSRVLAEERRERELSLRDMQRAADQEKKILTERVRANIEAERKIRDAARETRAGNYRARAAGTYGSGYGRGSSLPSEADFRSHIEDVAKGYEAQERAASRAAATQQRHIRELVSGSKQAAAGVGSIARAFVYLGVSGEENIEKAVRLFAKFEAGMSGIRGVSDVVGGLSKAGRAYGALGSGAGLAAGIGAVGVGGTIGLGAAALATGAGVGFGIGRAAIGGESFGRMTDAWGVTDYAGEQMAANRGRIANTASRQGMRRRVLGERYADFNTISGFDIADAEARGGLGAASSTARAAVFTSRQRSAALENRINTGRAGSIEEFSAERVAAKQGELAALNTALTLEERRKSIVMQTVQAEREKTKAVREGIEASKASLGLADAETVALAERAAGKRRRGETGTREEVSALGQFYGEVGQQEAAKLGADVLQRNPELAKLADEIAKTRAANEKAVLVKVEESVTGKIVVTPNSAQLIKDIESTVQTINEQIRQALREEFEAVRKDRESRDDIVKRSNGL